FVVPAAWAEVSDGRRSPLQRADGSVVKTPAEWAVRRAEIRREWFALMGPWPEPIATPRVEVLGETRRENFTEQRIRIEVARGMRLDGYLLVPDGAGKLPAVLVPYYEPESSVGRGKPQRDLGLQLARRGIAALCIGSPGGDAFKPDVAGAACQPLAFLAYIASNACTALTQHPRIDAARIGVVGHSYGGKWAMFAACFDERFAAAAWSDPGIVFDETRVSINYQEPWYLGLDANTTRARGLVTAENPRTGAYREL
ncbi:MAG: sialidase, partial [Verrucomicrobiales bacterium VVV1]